MLHHDQPTLPVHHLLAVGANSGSAGGSPALVWVVIAFIVAVGIVLLVRSFAGRNRRR